MQSWDKYIGVVILVVIVGYLIAIQAGGEDFMKQLESHGASKYIEAMNTQDDIKETMEKSSGTATIFVPNDAAMNSWKDHSGFMSNKRKMRRFLKYSIVLGDLTAQQCVEKERHVTADGTEVTIKKEGGNIVVIGGIGKAKVITSDIKFSNGYINIIDTVLLPKDI